MRSEGKVCAQCVLLHLLASEPNLKVKHKLKKHLNTRKSPLTRKESAPPTVKLGKFNTQTPMGEKCQK